MASLARDLRKELEKTVKQARRVAEAGAQKVLEQLGVQHHEPYGSMSLEQRTLRNRLRAHSRQLGDHRDSQKGTQTISRLMQECAYEHWHRMLFARFLAETDLLIEPQSGVAITLEECRELAQDKGADWLGLASDYAERMLPQIFRKDDPVLEIALPAETRSELEDLLKCLTTPVFEAGDSLGWVYQFWQADKKDEVNKSEVKIGGDELPAVTQLFTEDYMVLFLLHNTLGAWWAGKVLAANPCLAASAQDEDALRAACKVGEIDWTYLRFVRDKADDGTEGLWHPAAGVFEGWPKVAKNLTMLDPCMGSGHFLVFALPILTAIRMAEEGLSQSAAVDAVLKDNLFGLEIDPRCTQIAAFNLAFAAWRLVGYRPLPQPNLACSGLAIGVTKAEWLKLAEKAVTAADPAAKRDLLGVEKNLLTVGLEERVKNGLEALYDLFAKAPWLGSLIDPRRAGGDIFREGFDKLEPLLASILAAADTDDAREMAVAAQGMAKAAELLGKSYTLVVTNVPYLGRSKQSEVIKEYCDLAHSNSKADLGACLAARCIGACSSGGTIAVVAPQTWLYLGPYRKFRVELLQKFRWNFVGWLGPKAFQTSLWDFNISLVSLTRAKPIDDALMMTWDASDSPDPASIQHALTTRDGAANEQAKNLNNPDERVLFNASEQTSCLGDHAISLKGIATGDLQRFVVRFWEVPTIANGWELLQGSVQTTTPFGGRSSIVIWEGGHGRLFEFVVERLGVNATGAWIRGEAAWGKKGVAIAQISSLGATLYTGDLFDENTAAIVPHDKEDLAALWSYCSSNEFREEVRKLDDSMKVPTLTLLKVPFDRHRWRDIARQALPDGLPTPWSNDPTQSLFDGRPNVATSPLDVATPLLPGYQWPRRTGASFLDCPAPGPDGLEAHVDTDGIVCLTALKGEPPAEQRLNALLVEAFSADWSAAKLAGLLADVGYAGKSLDDWLRDGFFAHHCELFQQRPFIWHIWDGRRDGFHAIVNYHRLSAPNGEGRRTLEKLIYSYLGDWIDRQRADQKANVEGADARLAHAEHLKAELIKILEGKPPYDIFVRWKPLHEQPLGWDPDINDGVRMNIRPFMTARPLDARAKNASILRATPNIKWKKDRGKEPVRDKDDYPWYWGWDESTADFAGSAKFDGNRWNDLHYSNSEKQAARTRRLGQEEGNT